MPPPTDRTAAPTDLATYLRSVANYRTLHAAGVSITSCWALNLLDIAEAGLCRAIAAEAVAAAAAAYVDAQAAPCEEWMAAYRELAAAVGAWRESQPKERVTT